MARLSVCAAVLVGLTGPAAGQHARHPRQQPPPPSAVPSERLVPPPKPTTPAPTKPTIDADAVLSIESLRGTPRTEQEQILIDLIQNTPDSEVEEKTDYYFRLGELYTKQQRLYRIKAAQLKAPAEAAKAAEQAKAYLLKAVRTYKALTDNDAFRNYPKLDIALFYYAYVLQGGKYMKEARFVYDKLIKNFPNSKYVPEAFLAFADYYFDAGQLADAQARYERVLQFPKSSVYAYAHYKLGWIHLQLERKHEAAAAFQRAIVATRSEPKQAELYRAAQADLARVQPATPSPCQRQHQIALATLTTPTATSAAVVKQVDELVRVYKSEKKPDDLCRVNTAIMTSDLADIQYGLFAQTQAEENLDHADHLYAAHVALFSDAEDVRARYAELLWTRADREADAKLRTERWVRAANVFATLQGPDAARATALAWMNALDIALPADTNIVVGKAPRARPRAQPLKGHDAKLVAAVATYASQAPSADDELAQMRLAVALVLRRYRHFDEAATALDQFLEHHQDHASAEFAASLMLDSMMQARQLDELVDVAAAISADQDFLDGKPGLQNNLLLLRRLLPR
jgi:tetratricopeptide (TPR) repeat protein